jgi:hypothetical protein
LALNVTFLVKAGYFEAVVIGGEQIMNLTELNYILYSKILERIL